MIIEDARILVKYSTISGDEPTIPESSDHTDGTWLPTDVYIGEFFLNTVDSLLWIRTDDGIVPIGSTSGTASFIGDYVKISGGTYSGPVFGPSFSSNELISITISTSYLTASTIWGTHYGDGSNLTGIVANWNGGTVLNTVTFSSDFYALGDTYLYGNIVGSGSVNFNSDIEVNGGVSASYFIGDGSGLTNLPVPEFTDVFTTGVTLSGTNLIFSRNNDSEYSVDIDPILATAGIAGSSWDDTTNTFTITTKDGTTYDTPINTVNGLSSTDDITAPNFYGVFNGTFSGDVYTNNVQQDGSNLIFFRTDGGSYSVNLSAIGATGPTGPAGGGVTGSGTALYVPRWETSTRLTNSTIQYDSSNRIGINSTPISNAAVRITSTYSINQSLSVSGANSNSYLTLGTNAATVNAYGHVTTIGQGFNSNLAFLANLGSGWSGQTISAGFAYLEGGFVNKQTNAYVLYGLMNGTSGAKWGFDLQLTGNNLSTNNYGGRLFVSGASSSNNGLNISVSGTNSIVNYGLDISVTANTTGQATAIRTTSGNILFNSSYGNYDFVVRGLTSSNHLIFGKASTNNVGIGTFLPNPVAKLDVESTTSGFLPPRMTTAQRDAISAVAGLVVYNTTTNKHQGFNGTTWNDFY